MRISTLVFQHARAIPSPWDPETFIYTLTLLTLPLQVSWNIQILDIPPYDHFCYQAYGDLGRLAIREVEEMGVRDLSILNDIGWRDGFAEYCLDIIAADRSCIMLYEMKQCQQFP